MKKLNLLLISVICWSFIFSQDNILSPDLISSCGNTSSNSEVKVNWSIGENFTETVINTNVKVTQGFHQPKYVVNSISDNTIITDTIEIYPNPAKEFITIKYSSIIEGEIYIILTDSKGSVLSIASENHKSFTKNIPLSETNDGVLFLSIIQNKLLLKSVKIVHN